MKPSQFVLKASVIAISFALAACGGGGGGGSSPSVGSTPSKPSVPDNSGTPTVIPMPSANPAAGDSKEQAAAPEPITNKFAPNKYGFANDRADSLNLKEAYDQGLDGFGVKVGIVDGRITNHPALPTTVVDHGDFVPGMAGTNSDHGTKVALALSGKDVNGTVNGIAKNIELHKANIGLANRDQVSGSGALRAWNELRKDGVTIINNSWGSTEGTAIPQYRHDANAYLNATSISEKAGTYIGQVKHLIDNNTLLIFSTGNEALLQPTANSLLPLAEPELQKGLIAVAGIDPNQTINSNSNRCGDAKNWCMVANWRVYTASMYAKNQSDLDKMALSPATGTSFAAPQVTGAAALVKQKYPWMSNDNLRTTLLTTATDLGAKGVDSVYGWGLLNIGKAVNGPAQFAFGDFNANVTGNSVFENNISGNGGLLKKGSGSLTLKGKHSFSGDTLISAGKLMIDGESQSKTTVLSSAEYAVKGSTGSINNLGVFASTGNGATINGDYIQTQYGTLATEVGTVTKVTGNADLAGELHFRGIKSGYVSQSGTSTDVLTATKVSGKFDKTTSAPSLLLTADTRYTANAVKLDIKRADVSRVAGSLQVAADAGGISAGARNLEAAFTALDAASYQSDRVAQALSFVDASAKIQNITDEATLAKTLYSLSGSIYSNAAAVSSIEHSRLHSDFGNKLNVAAGETAAIAQYGHTGNNWTQPGLSGKQSSNSGMVGAVHGLSEGFSIGAAYTYQNTNWSEQRGNDGAATADVDSHGILVGSRYQPANWRGHFLKGTLGYSRYSNDVSRTVWIADDAYRTGADVSGSLWQLGIAGGKKLGNDVWSVTPELGLRYDYFRQSAFTENGAEGYGLNADKLSKGIVVGTVNMTGQYNWLAGNLPLSVYGNIGYEHDFQRRQFATTGGFADAHSHERAGAWQLPLNRWAAGVGLQAQVAKNVTAGIGYRYQGASSWHNHQAGANLIVKF